MEDHPLESVADAGTGMTGVLRKALGLFIAMTYETKNSFRR